MSLFCIVGYDLSRDKIGGVQNRMFRFINGLKTQKKLTIVVFNLYYDIPYVDLSNKIKIYNCKTPSDLNKELLTFSFNNLIDYLYFADYRHILGINDIFF